ncbi:Tic20 family protein [Tumidithrix helvetica PCC 7403]|uniref:Tic20 family protein n=1 Tax=Tumidithrix helvetica TaxID=3457545 RepID=UPI003C96D328
MALRGSVAPLDRLYGCLPYLLPMSAAVFYGVFLFGQFPPLATIFFPLIWLKFLLGFPIIPQVISLDFVVFICVYMFVVRNERVNHFVRFNAMQALLLGIVLVLIQILVSLLQPALPSASSQALIFVVQIFANTIFVGMMAACGFSIFQSIRGLYAEMPIVSEAAYYQVRF